MRQLSLRSTTVRQLAQAAAGKLVAAAAGLLCLRVFTELVAPEVYGETSLILGLATVGIGIFVSPISEAQLRLYPNHMRDGTGAPFTGVVFQFALAAAGLLVLLAAGSLVLYHGVERQGYDSLLIFSGLAGFILATAAKNVYLNRLNAEGRQGWFSLWTATEPVFLVMLGAGILSFRPDVPAMMGVYCGSVTLTLALILIFDPHKFGAYRQSRFELSSGDRLAIWNELRRFGWPFVVFGTLGWLVSLFDRYAIAALLDLKAVGTYVVVFTLASQLVLIPSGILAQVLRPKVYAAATVEGSSESRFVLQAWGVTLLLGGGALILAIELIGDSVLPLLLAPDYLSGTKNLLLLLTFAFQLRAIAQLLETEILAFATPRFLYLPKGVGALVNVLASLALIQEFGVTGAAWSAILVSAAMLGLTALQLRLSRRQAERQP